MQDFRQMIVSNPHVMMGKPIIVGTRITVESILETGFELPSPSPGWLSGGLRCRNVTGDYGRGCPCREAKFSECVDHG
jgi:hypothetical protein